jgi:hypothetical protein
MVTAAGRELEMRASSRDLKEHPVIAVVTLKPADLRKPDAIPVERDNFIKPIGMTSDTQLHRTIIANMPDNSVTWLSGHCSTQIGRQPLSRNPRRLETMAGVVRGFRLELAGSESSKGVDVAVEATKGQCRVA